MKVCYKCKEEKELDRFPKRKTSRDGRKGTCKKCINTKAREVWDPEKEKARWARYRLKNNDAIRDRQFKAKYGISLADYDNMYELQFGRCSYCLTHQDDLEKVLVVDHDHSFEKGDPAGVRSLLCSDCNVGLGMFKDNPNVLRRAADDMEHRRNNN